LLKIISGVWGGRRLQSPRGENTRPSSARLREALFAILESKGMVADVRVLDLCAGSGALGLEALSRGARLCVFFEKDIDAVSALRSNIDLLKVGAKALVMARDFRRPYTGQTFEVVLADPPYNQGLASAILPWLAANNLLALQGVAVIEHSAQEQPGAFASFKLMDKRRYGQSIISFFSK
jgi:16S rRNA (guanine966-N2)-methyltransferase